MILLERSALLETFAAFLCEASLGRGALIFLGGEAGVGKTALVEALCLGARGVRVARGACDSLSAPRPLGPLVDAAHALGLETALGTETARTEVFRALLERLSAATPTLLVFEDVHWADEATLDLLRFLGRRVGGTRALAIATYRDDETGPGHPLRVLLGDLATAASVRRVALSPLSEGAVAVLADGSGLDPKALFEQTAGNPFFVTEIVSSGLAGIPPTVRDAVLARAARLSARARTVLDAAAVIGSRFEPDVLTAVVGPDFEALEEGLAMGVLRADGALIAFRHELARQSLLESLSPPRALDLHRRVLTALRALPSDPDRLARLAHHAEAAGDGAAVLEYAPEAARRAAHLRAHREAAAQYARALRFAAPLPTVDRAALLEAHAYECYLTDQLEEAAVSRQRALSLWHGLGEPQKEGENLRWLSRINWFLGRNAEAERYAQSALEVLEPQPQGLPLAMAYSNLSQLRMLASDTDGAVSWGEKAAALARQFGDAATLSHALNNIGTARFVKDLKEGELQLEESLRLALTANLEEHAARAWTNLASSFVQDWQFERAKPYLEDGIGYTIDHDLDSWRAYMQGWQAVQLSYQARWDEAVELAHALTRHSRLAPISRIQALVALGRVRTRRGDPEVWPALDEALHLATGTNEVQRLAPVSAARAEAFWLEGRGELALGELRASYEVALGKPRAWLLGELAYWRWKLGDLKEAPEGLARPFALQIGGQPLEAAEAWRALDCPYEAARARAESDDETALKTALAELDRLGARPLAGFVTKRLRELGIKGIARGPRPTTKTNLAGLTVRELEVLHLLARGQRDKEIARSLNLSAKTVEHHVSAILSKLGARSRTEAVQEAAERGVLIQPGGTRPPT